MIDLLIVEDESLLRQGIAFLGPWEKDGFTIAGEAANGVEALEILNHRHVDIVLTDIVMPIMNGLELLRGINRLSPRPDAVVLSNYDDFDFVRQALQLGARDYMLKSEIEYERLTQLLRDIASRRTEAKRDTLRQLRDVRFLLYRLLMDAHQSEAELRDLFERADMPLSFPAVCLVAGIRQSPGEQETMIDFLSWASALPAELAPQLNCADHAVFIVSPERLTHHIDLLCHAGRQCLGDVCVSVGPVEGTYAKLRDSYRLALEARDLWFYQDSEPLVHAGDARVLRGNDSYPAAPPPGEGYAAALEARRAILDAAVRDGSFTRPGDLLERCKNLEHTLIMRRFGASDMAQASREMLLAFSRLEKLTRYTELRAQLKEDISRLFSVDTDAETWDMGDRIQRYLEAHFKEDISLEEIARLVHMNYCYVSRLFARKTGESIVKYVTRRRLETACALLEDSDAPVSAIAESCGYADAGYFSRIFKKSMGISPKEYRDARPARPRP